MDIFNRLQYGVAISRGAFIKSIIREEKTTMYIIEMADRYKEYFGKYAGDIQTEAHIIYLIETIFMIEDGITQIKKTTVERRLKKMTIEKIKELDKRYEELIKVMYSVRILNKYNFSKKIIINMLIYGKDKKIDVDKMEIVIDKINKNNENKKKIDNIIEFADKIYNEDYDEDEDEEVS